MKIQLEDRWQLQRAELINDGPIGQGVLDFMTDWADAAEQDGGYAIKTAPMQYLNATLTSVENARGERYPVQFLGSMLVILAANWEYGPDLRANMTEIEWRLLADTLAAKISQLQAEAEKVTNDPTA